MSEYLRYPKILNFELTTVCPWKCLQCYKNVGNIPNKNFDWTLLQLYITEAKKLGVGKILFSGGEPLLYPYIIQAITLVKDYNMELNISTSGVTITNELYKVLARVDALYVSLNGSTEEINKKSREGFKEAVGIIQLAPQKGIKTKINWVARNDNVYDFPQLYDFAEKMGVGAIDILKNKPNASGLIDSHLSYKDIVFLANFIKEHKGRTQINIESCFYELKNLCGIRIRNPIMKGCSAGRYSMSIDVNGHMLPCTHIKTRDSDYRGSSLAEFWHKDKALNQFRQNNKKYNECNDCEFLEWCKPCVLNIDRNCILKST